MAHKNAFDARFELLEQKLKQFHRLLLKIKHGTQNGESIAKFRQEIAEATALCEVCLNLKRDIQYAITKYTDIETGEKNHDRRQHEREH